MQPAQLIVGALTFIFPAYCANAIPVIAGGGLPLDFGKAFVDGKPIFGKNKTFRGFFFGLAVGTAVGFAETIVFSESAFFNYPCTFGILMSLGALFGDLTAAFAKRRLGLAPGDLFPILDQTSFMIGAILFSLPVSVKNLSLGILITVLVLTPPIHLLTNFVAYKLGLKSNPW
jgi:CDP-2,3-bis-(O-geranylgeranyl)-sn-glycerol synthase